MSIGNVKGANIRPLSEGCIGDRVIVCALSARGIFEKDGEPAPKPLVPHPPRTPPVLLGYSGIRASCGSLSLDSTPSSQTLIPLRYRLTPPICSLRFMQIVCSLFTRERGSAAK